MKMDACLGNMEKAFKGRKKLIVFLTVIHEVIFRNTGI